VRRPEAQYAKSGDAHIAYQVHGDGPTDLLVMIGEWVPIDAMFDEPRYARALDRLASFSRVICFDRRGTGLSDPFTPDAPPTIEQWLDDALAVLDAAGSQRTSVMATTDAGMAGVLLAASYPERTEALVLVNAYARVLWAPDYPWGLSRDVAEAGADEVTAPAGAGEEEQFLERFAPSVADDKRFREWWIRVGKRGASPAVARALWQVSYESDVRHVLGSVGVPTLVLHCSSEWFAAYKNGAYLAEHIGGAVRVSLKGADFSWWTHGDELLDEVQEFLTGTPPQREPDRVLATVLFTDIVGSTQTGASMGDRRWREVLDRHNSACAHEIERHQGRLVKSTGDGLLATFDGPARAVRCACAIRDAVVPLGIEIRAGLHTGEIELLGDDVTGVAVNTGARVMSVATPGEVLVSRTVTDLVAGSGLSFAERGEHELKGVPGRWQLYAVAG
jgi:class 3 adenylate cyclase